MVERYDPGARAISHLPAPLPRRLRVERAQGGAPAEARRRRDDGAARFRDGRRRDPVARTGGRRGRRRAVLSRMGAGVARTLGRRSQASRRERRPADMFEVFARYDLLDDSDTRPTYTAIARGVESDTSDRDQSSRGDAAAVPEDRARAAARADVERGGVGGRSREAARARSTAHGRRRTADDLRSRDRSPARCGGVAGARCALRDHRRGRLTAAWARSTSPAITCSIATSP